MATVFLFDFVSVLTSLNYVGLVKVFLVCLKRSFVRFNEFKHEQKSSLPSSYISEVLYNGKYRQCVSTVALKFKTLGHKNTTT